MFTALSDTRKKINVQVSLVSLEQCIRGCLLPLPAWFRVAQSPLCLTADEMSETTTSFCCEVNASCAFLGCLFQYLLCPLYATHHFVLQHTQCQKLPRTSAKLMCVVLFWVFVFQHLTKCPKLPRTSAKLIYLVLFWVFVSIPAFCPVYIIDIIITTLPFTRRLVSGVSRTQK